MKKAKKTQFDGKVNTQEEWVDPQLVKHREYQLGEAVDFAVKHFPLVVHRPDGSIDILFRDGEVEIARPMNYEFMQWYLELILVLTGHKVMVDPQFLEQKVSTFKHKQEELGDDITEETAESMCQEMNLWEMELVLCTDWTHRKELYEGEEPVHRFKAKGPQCVQLAIHQLSEWLMSTMFLKLQMEEKLRGLPDPMRIVRSALGWSDTVGKLE